MKTRGQFRNMFMLFCLFALCGCSKHFLDTKIDIYATPQTIITDRATLFGFANAFYVDLPNGFNALDNNLFAAATDDGQQTAQYSTTALLFNQGGLNPNSINMDAGSGFYKKMYDGIRAANFFLDYSTDYVAFLSLNRDTINEITNYTKDKLYIHWYRGEAHIARAFYYAQLIKRYGGVPLITQTLKNANHIDVPKASYQEVVDFIISEIDQYTDSLQQDWKSSAYSDQEGRFTQGAALALKARVLLYDASPLHNPENDLTKWRNAAAAADQVIALQRYSLDPNYGDYFTGDHALSSNETIFAIRQPAGNTPERLNYPISTPGGNSGMTPTQNLVSAYENLGYADPNNPYVNRDPRLAATIVLNGSTWNGRTIDESLGGSDDMTKPNTSRTGYYLKKFLTDNLNLVQNGTARHPWVVFRYAEILLDYAEAMNEAYGPDDNNGYSLTARQALQMVRDRASNNLANVTALSKDDFRTAVKHERRVELAFEGHRYWDLLRWKDAEFILNKSVMGVRVTKNTNGSFNYQEVQVADRVFTQAMYYFPFSQSEIVNSGHVLIQNPGY